METFKLSTKQDWKNHWKKHNLVRVIPEYYSFHQCLKKTAEKLGDSCRSIELGGFPGCFSVYLKKYCGMDITILDYILDRQIVESLAALNGLHPGDVKVIEADVFSYLSEDAYDLVCSFGFIEHFTDLDQVLGSHLKFMKPGGLLLVTLPNFRGINGLLQKLFDPANLAIHNLEVMDLELLRKSLTSLGMQDIQVEYYASTQVWLEGLSDRSLILRLIVRFVNESVKLLGKAFGAQSRWLSNSIVIHAKKPLETK
jgi:SAM-dependent methyltransferase